MNLKAKQTSITVVAFAIFLIAVATVLLVFSRRVESISMLPTLEPGDLVFLQGVSSPSDIHLGDVIVYNPPCSQTIPPASVIHRVVQVLPSGFITKGDNNGITDQAGGIAGGPVTMSCIAGKVIFVIPYLEQLARLPYGLNYVVAILIFAIVIYAELAGRRPKGEDSGGDLSPKVEGAP